MPEMFASIKKMHIYRTLYICSVMCVCVSVCVCLCVRAEPVRGDGMD